MSTQLWPIAVVASLPVWRRVSFTWLQDTVARHGRLDVLFCNAGTEGRVAPLSEMPVEDFDRVMAVNVRGVFLGLKHAMPIM